MPDTSTIHLISTDVAQAMGRILRMDSFLSESLQAIAREVVTRFFLSDTDEYGDVVGASRCFSEAVSSQLGDEVLANITAWERVANPPHDREVSIWSWSMAFVSLRRKWDEEGLNDDIALSRPDLSWARFLIGEYCDHQQSIAAEYGDVSDRLDSDWDRRVDQDEEDWFYCVESNIWTAFRNLITPEFWQRLSSNLGQQDLADLESWARREAVFCGLFPPDITLPTLTPCTPGD